MAVIRPRPRRRPGDRRRSRCRLEARGERWAGAEATHATETAFVSCDIRLECSGGLDALEATAACLAGEPHRRRRSPPRPGAAPGIAHDPRPD